MVDGVFHVIPALLMAEEQRQIEPGQGAAVAGFDGGAVFFFGGGEVFLLLRDPALELVGFGGIERSQCLGLSFGFVAPAADDSGRFQIKFAQIAARIHVVWIQS